MSSAGPTIGLSMIVKNEAHVILRCLESVRPLVDYVLIEDTGSTDGTQAIIREWLDRVGLPGEVIEEPWIDFAFNRTHALLKLREHSEIDYALVIDADDRITVDEDFDAAAFKAGLTADFYDLEIYHGSIRHHRPHIFRNNLDFSYRGALHEFLVAPATASTRATAKGLRISIVGGGARSQDKEKFQRDAALLENALKTEQDPFLISRYTFYLAQSYRDCGEAAKALEAYLRRAELGFWQEEVYLSLYHAAQMKEQLAHPEQEVIDTYLRASDALPTRAEALHGASRFCRNKGRNEEGYQIAKRGLDIPIRSDALFVETWIYETGLLDEFAINAYWSGHYRDCLDASLKILATGKLSGANMQRVVANARFASEKLPRDPNLGSLGKDGFIEQHALGAPRSLRTRLDSAPRVLVAILAKQKEPTLPLYLRCIEALDYPKSSIVLYIRTNNNTDRTEQILRDWVASVGHLYAAVEFDAEDVGTRVEQFGVHEWNAPRFRVLGRIRNISMSCALAHNCDFYFVCDVDNFVRPCTLRELVALNVPIVAPFLRLVKAGAFYSNYHAEVDGRGYFSDCDQYQWVLNRWIRGVVEMPVVHCTYLVRADVIPELTYEDEFARHEYVIFSDTARRSSIPQYFDNRQLYGYLTLDENLESAETAAQLLADDLTVSSKKNWSSSIVQCSVEFEPDRRIAMLHEINLINLDRSVERLRTFTERNSHLKNVVRFAAADGTSVDRATLLSNGTIAADLAYLPGALGCALSHVELWKRASSQNRLLTIFEDDVICSFNFEKELAKLVSCMPADWDIILWGYVFDPLYIWVDLGFSKSKMEFYENRVRRDLKTFQAKQFSYSAVKLAHSFGTQAYSLSPKGARVLLEHCLPLRERFITFPGASVVTKDVGIDVAMCGAYDFMRAFVCIPPLVIEDNTQISVRSATDQIQCSI